MIATVLFAAALAATPADVNREVDLDEQLGRVITIDRAFKDQHGTSVKLADYFNDGKPVIIVLAYFRCPSLCDLVLSSLVDALRAIDWTPGSQFRIITISIDPSDRPAEAARRQTLLLQKLGHPEAAANWPFLVGDEKPLGALADELGFRYVYDPQSRLYAHPAALFILTSQARISRYLYGVGFPPRDVRLALVEAGQGRVGTIVDRILMTCFRYDPSARRYGLVVWGVMRGGSLIVLIALGGLLLYLRRRERARSAS